MRENNMMLEENAAKLIRNVIACGMLLSGWQNGYFLATFTHSLILWWFGGFVCELSTAFNIVTG